ncbi:MAG: hypothetical protein A2W91_17365 [Bacteroidetes bacterium GWF2_38_335]|nr:MAG: hypothetical protein A2W91_17365 [Bacteroidetes bacterium GWF2_38_335]OFY78634.1 MAG: hypothetical protein A2281_16390 [Bacteroidetes bacterium RIFOXYA12_FULL_38_20]HBS88370.1 hypothetical protein [Bacteroidales bacterium]
MRKILTGLFLLISITSFSQTVKELEYELSYFNSEEEWGNKKDIAFNLLKIDSLNANAINYLVEVYGRNDKKDSISWLFEKLIKEHPRSPEPYLIRVREQNAHFAGLTYTQQINFLKEANKLDSVNTEAIYTLGKLYYELFIQEFNKNKKNANLDFYSSNAIQYFSKLCNQNEEYKETLRFPLIQLTNYTGDLNKKKQYESYNIQSSYFPISAFVDLPKEWQTNFSVNVIDYVSGSDFNYYGVEFAIFSINWYSKHLTALEEPVLSDSLPTKIFRFTYLRTFDNPIVIGIENTNDTISIYWKVSDGAGGYEPGKLIENRKKELTVADWEKIENKVNSIKFWNLPTVEKSLLGSDGSQWIFEGKTLGNYHVVDRWCGGIIYSVCKDLIKLTDLEIKENDIY